MSAWAHRGPAGRHATVCDRRWQDEVCPSHLQVTSYTCTAAEKHLNEMMKELVTIVTSNHSDHIAFPLMWIMVK